MKRHQRWESHACFLCPMPHGTAVGQGSGYLCRNQHMAPYKMTGVTGKWEKLRNLSSRPFAISVVDRSASLPTEGHPVRRREGAGPPQTTVALFRLQSVGCKEGSHSGNSPEWPGSILQELIKCGQGQSGYTSDWGEDRSVWKWRKHCALNLLSAGAYDGAGVPQDLLGVLPKGVTGTGRRFQLGELWNRSVCECASGTNTEFLFKNYGKWC